MFPSVSLPGKNKRKRKKPPEDIKLETMLYKRASNITSKVNYLEKSHKLNEGDDKVENGRWRLNVSGRYFVRLCVQKVLYCQLLIVRQHYYLLDPFYLGFNCIFLSSVRRLYMVWLFNVFDYECQTLCTLLDQQIPLHFSA